MLATRALTSALNGLSGQPVHGTFCRAVHPGTLYGFKAGLGYVPRPLYDLGAPRSGARFTPKGGAPALYLAEDHATALQEMLQVGAHAGLKPVFGMSALVLFQVSVQLASVLDLTDAGVPKAIRTNAKELAGPWRLPVSGKRPPTQALGAAVATNGRFDGMLFQSTKGPGRCLVAFTANLRPPAFVEIRDPSSKLVERLP